MASTIMFTTSNTLLKRSNVILRYSYRNCSRNLNTQQVSEKATGTLSKLAAFQRQIVYNVKVLKEIAKEVYTKENLGPPNGAQVSEAWEGLKSIRWQGFGEVSPKDFIKIGIHSIEVAGFFALGEMIGRRNIIGYKV